MIDLMGLELKKHNIQTYIISSAIIMVSLLGFLYLFAFAPQIEPNDPDMKIFAGYNNIISLFSVISMTVFSTLSATMYSKFIISEYIGKRTILMFSYPIDRKKMLLSKIGVVSLYIITSLIITNLIAFCIFGITEQIYPIMNEIITTSIVANILKTTLNMAILSSSIGIGFIKKSVPTTIISAVVISSLFCNIVANSLQGNGLLTVFTIITVSISVIIVGFLMRNIEAMEVK